MKRFSQFLTEKLILISNGKKYGQIVFLVGGAASGKGFARDNFMEKEKFKIRDVDEWKKSLQMMAKLVDDPVKFAKLTDAGTSISPERYKEIKDLDLRKPADVLTFHKWVEASGIKDKTLDSMIAVMRKPEILPNIMFDITAKDINDIAKFMPKILAAGYNPANIHIVWVLTNYTIALSNNMDPNRGRVVPEDIMMWTHKGAAQTMFDYIQGQGKKLAINGAIHVILNNRENTIYWGNPKKKGEKLDVIKDFKYLTLKDRGKSMKKEKSIQRQLYQWIVDNIPTGDLLKALVDRGVKKGRSGWKIRKGRRK